MVYEDVVMDNEFSEDDEMQDNPIECLFDSVEDEEDSDYEDYIEDGDSDEMKLKKSRYIGNENKYRFFKLECERYEFSRTPITFRLGKDSTDYHGIVLKELDQSHFVFLIDAPDASKGKKMKKIDITDISIYY